MSRGSAHKQPYRRSSPQTPKNLRSASITTMTTSSPLPTDSSTPESLHACSGESSPMKPLLSLNMALTLINAPVPCTPISATNVGKSSLTIVPSIVPNADNAVFVVASTMRPPPAKYPTSNVLRSPASCQAGTPTLEPGVLHHPPPASNAS